MRLCPNNALINPNPTNQITALKCTYIGTICRPLHEVSERGLYPHTYWGLDYALSTESGANTQFWCILMTNRTAWNTRHRKFKLAQGRVQVRADNDIQIKKCVHTYVVGPSLTLYGSQCSMYRGFCVFVRTGGCCHSSVAAQAKSPGFDSWQLPVHISLSLCV